MATETMKAERAARKLKPSDPGLAERHYPTPEHPHEMDPQDLPTVYASVATGRCLEPVFEDGECLAFSSSAALEPGDFVGICFHPDHVPEGEPARLVKRLRSIPPFTNFPYRAAPGSEVVPLIELEQLDPPRLYRIPADRLLSMDKVIGTAIGDGSGKALLVPLEPERLERARDMVLIRQWQLGSSPQHREAGNA